MSSADTDPHAAALRWLVRRFGPPRGWPILGLASGLFQTAMTLALSALLAHVLYGLAIERQPLSELDSAWWSLPLCWVLRALAGVMREEAGARASLSVRSRLRVALLEALYRLGPAWVTKRQTGGLTAAVLEQVEAVDGYFSRYRPQQWLAALGPLMIVLAVLPFSWAAAAILLLTAPLIPLFMVLVGWGARQKQTEQMLAMQRMGGHFLDMIRGLPTLRLLDAHHRMGDEVAKVADAFRQRTMSVLRLAFLSGTVLEFFSSVAIALTATYFGLSLLGHLNFGFYGNTLDLKLALFVLLLAPEFYQPLRDLGTHYHARAEALAAAHALREILEADSPQPTGGDERPAHSPPSLRLESVDFAHRAGEPVLTQCQIDVAGGEAVAIQGPSGGGKTTLLRLILGQLSPDNGQVLVGGVPMGDLDVMAWRERVAWMSQHPRLMAATLADNLRVARSDADNAVLLQAIEFAGLLPWFQTLPEGLDTLLGEGGRSLSGGQLRRLALARVCLRRADVLLLDEPTASLDADTEALVVSRLARLRQGCTVVVLTHRSAPLALADRVLYLQNGKLMP